MDSTQINTVLGWTVTLVGAGVAYYYYTQPDGRQRSFKGREVRTALPRQNLASIASDSENAKKKKKREERAKAVPRNTAVEKPSETTQITSSTRTEPEEKEDLAWAEELDKRKKGTSLAPPARSANKSRTVKQSNANNKAAELSASSSTGGDADDDLSPVASPALNGFHEQEAPSGNSISDMLEPAAPGPSVLKLTEPLNPVKSKPKQQVRAAQEVESKKQRQNRKKAEEKKAQREADEKERRALEERQRRAAREARGEPSKNGLGISAPPSSIAWKATNGAAAAPAPVVNGGLLDTFSNDATSTDSTAPTSISSSPVQQSRKENWWKGDIPSEEEQERLIREQDDSSWNTVPAKKNRRKNQVNGDSAVEVA